MVHAVAVRGLAADCAGASLFREQRFVVSAGQVVAPTAPVLGPGEVGLGPMLHVVLTGLHPKLLAVTLPVFGRLRPESVPMRGAICGLRHVSRDT